MSKLCCMITVPEGGSRLHVNFIVLMLLLKNPEEINENRRD